jgi:SH3 domain-containing YSC84-like protein 1
VGRDLEGSMAIGAVMYTYSRSQGLFAGVSLEGTVIGTRDDANAEFYGKPVQAREILSGSIAPPAGAQKLLKFLSKY